MVKYRISLIIMIIQTQDNLEYHKLHLKLNIQIIKNNI
jgi:hypothetical protein